MTDKTETVPAAKAPKAAVPAKLIYIGPTLADFSVVKYQIFIGGLPSVFDDSKRMTLCRRLCVPVPELTQKEREMNTKGTPLYKYAAEIASTQRR